jgi:hypothetical protein
MEAGFNQVYEKLEDSVNDLLKENAELEGRIIAIEAQAAD